MRTARHFRVFLATLVKISFLQVVRVSAQTGTGTIPMSMFDFIQQMAKSNSKAAASLSVVPHSAQVPPAFHQNNAASTGNNPTMPKEVQVANSETAPVQSVPQTSFQANPQYVPVQSAPQTNLQAVNTHYIPVQSAQQTNLQAVNTHYIPVQSAQQTNLQAINSQYIPVQSAPQTNLQAANPQYVPVQSAPQTNMQTTNLQYVPVQSAPQTNVQAVNPQYIPVQSVPQNVQAANPRYVAVQIFPQVPLQAQYPQQHQNQTKQVPMLSSQQYIGDPFLSQSSSQVAISIPGHAPPPYPPNTGTAQVRDQQFPVNAVPYHQPQQYYPVTQLPLPVPTMSGGIIDFVPPEHRQHYSNSNPVVNPPAVNPPPMNPPAERSHFIFSGYNAGGGVPMGLSHTSGIPSQTGWSPQSSGSPHNVAVPNTQYSSANGWQHTSAHNAPNSWSHTPQRMGPSTMVENSFNPRMSSSANSILPQELQKAAMDMGRSMGLLQFYESHGCVDPMVALPPRTSTIGLSLGCFSPESQRLCSMVGTAAGGVGGGNAAMMAMMQSSAMSETLEKCLSPMTVTNTIVKGMSGGSGGMDPMMMMMMSGGNGGGGGMASSLAMMKMMSSSGRGGVASTNGANSGGLPLGAAPPGGTQAPVQEQQGPGTNCMSVLPLVMSGGEGLLSPEMGDMVRDARRRMLPYMCQEMRAGAMPFRMCCPGKVHPPSVMDLMMSGSGV